MLARLSRHTLLLLVSNTGGAALSFALSVLIGRVLGAGGLGAYAVVLAWVYPVSLVVEFGLSSLATRDIAQDTSSSNAYLSAMARARLLLGGAATLAIIALAPMLSGDPVVVSGLIVSAPMVVILPFYSSFTAVYKARGAMWPVPILNIGMLAAQVVLTIWVFASGGGVVDALVVNTLTSLAQLVGAWAVWWWKFRSPHPVLSGNTHDDAPRKHLTVELGGLLRRALPFALAAFFAAVQVRLSILMLEQLATTQDVGFFAAASRFVEAGRMIPNAFFGALFPALSALAAQPTVMRHTFTRAMWILGAFGTVAALVTTFAAPLLLDLTYGDAFVPAENTLRILMIALLFSLLRGARTLYWYAVEREQGVNGVNAAVLALQAALGLWLIPTLGAVGAAWALLVSEATALALLSLDLRFPRQWLISYGRR